MVVKFYLFFIWFLRFPEGSSCYCSEFLSVFGLSFKSIDYCSAADEVNTYFACGGDDDDDDAIDNI